MNLQDKLRGLRLACIAVSSAAFGMLWGPLAVAGFGAAYIAVVCTMVELSLIEQETKP